MAKITVDVSHTNIAVLGICLAERLTRYFPRVEEIEPAFDCDIEIRKMADDLLEQADKVGSLYGIARKKRA